MLYKNEDFRIVELITASGTPNSLYLNGRTGFTNSIRVLNDISSIYGCGYGANSGRSITMDDIEQYSSFDKTNYDANQIGHYGDSKTYTVGEYFFKEVGKVVKDDGTVSTGYNLCRSNGTEVSWGEKVVPVVILDTNIKTNSNQNANQEWELIP